MIGALFITGATTSDPLTPFDFFAVEKKERKKEREREKKERKREEEHDAVEKIIAIIAPVFIETEFFEGA